MKVERSKRENEKGTQVKGQLKQGKGKGRKGKGKGEQMKMVM